MGAVESQITRCSRRVWLLHTWAVACRQCSIPHHAVMIMFMTKALDWRETQARA